MYVYNNLHDNIKKIFLFRIVYILLLIILNIYCITLLSIGYITPFLISIVVLNFISILNSVSHVWNLIETNDLDQSLGCDCHIPMFDIIIGIILVVIMLIYFIAIGDKFIIYEFIVMVIYGIVYFSIAAFGVLSFLGMLCFCCCERLIKTKEIVETRHNSSF